MSNSPSPKMKKKQKRRRKKKNKVGKENNNLNIENSTTIDLNPILPEENLSEFKDKVGAEDALANGMKQKKRRKKKNKVQQENNNLNCNQTCDIKNSETTDLNSRLQEENLSEFKEKVVAEDALANGMNNSSPMIITEQKRRRKKKNKNKVQQENNNLNCMETSDFEKSTNGINNLSPESTTELKSNGDPQENNKLNCKKTCDIEKSTIDINNNSSPKSKRKRKRNGDPQESNKLNSKKTCDIKMSTIDGPKALQIPPTGISVGCLKKKLLVLDVNGLLADIVPSPRPKDIKADAIIAKKALFKRPFYKEFLNFCFEKFDVAVWSSRLGVNVKLVVDYLMGKMKQKLIFCWDLSHCTHTGFNTLEDKYKPLVVKDLRKIWEKHDPNLPWKKGYYNESNTLLLDDSPYKGLLNPPYNSIFPHSFTYKNQDDKSLAVGGDLREYLEGLANAEDMLKYVEQHPFGQERLTEESKSWNFYSKVIDKLSAGQPKRSGVL
ncbi:uncharacterized protein [Cicer arietinum]|uniref:Mitochondrial import inner membrane translocase subunit TIM50 n=1 Tax=Cicer arietinum TaxID=3827 RepID=A0A1S2Z4B0_CICAR|nr:uncharacterized protein LOC101502736 isoform X2 [Cicer arietinum]